MWGTLTRCTLVLLTALAAGACRTPESDDARATSSPTTAAASNAKPIACAPRDPLGQPFYGDLHVHTRWSYDAYAFETHAGPDQAYAFARGEPIGLPPFDADGRPARQLRLDRSLDFAAVTDHAEMFGELRLCLDPTAEAWATPVCRAYRAEQGLPGPPELAHMQRLFDFMAQGRRTAAICGSDGARCRRAAGDLWREMVASARRWNAPCEFSAFAAYEWSQTARATNLHRNVIFRGERVPERATSSVEEPTPGGLWRALRRGCLDAGIGCDAIAIPHNSNLSNGAMFAPSDSAADPGALADQARTRLRLEPLVEIFQVKGDSECRNGLLGVRGGPDEQCDFEKMRPLEPPAPDCGDGIGEGGMAQRGCLSRRGYVRYAWAEGLRERARLGVNPFELGVIASTDTHNATPGAVSEVAYVGDLGVTDASVIQRLTRAPARPDWPGQARNLRDNPGGLAGVWAAQNTRDDLFEAMRRRETFGTSGPRIAPRLFGGWDYPSNLCERPDLLARAHAGGVPMGSTLPRRSASHPVPSLVAAATRDPGTGAEPGHPLERIQLIKVWIGDDANIHQSVYDVAGRAGSPGVDPACETPGHGFDQLCGVWRDPDFDPGRPTLYYARVLEIPSCRWSTLQCASLPEAERPVSCSHAQVPDQIQERAWTSPIWYTP